VHEPVAQLAVVRQQQQPLGLGVEPAHVEQPARPVDQLGALHDEVADAGATLVVRHGREHPERLVQRQVHDVVAQHDPAAVDVHDGGVRVDATAHLAYDLAVDGHPARGDELLGRAAGGHAGLGQHLLQPDSVRLLLRTIHCDLARILRRSRRREMALLNTTP
jgi:hypothetical protein